MHFFAGLKDQWIFFLLLGAAWIIKIDIFIYSVVSKCLLFRYLVCLFFCGGGFLS